MAALSQQDAGSCPFINWPLPSNRSKFYQGGVWMITGYRLVMKERSWGQQGTVQPCADLSILQLSSKKTPPYLKSSPAPFTSPFIDQYRLTSFEMSCTWDIP